MTNPTTAYLGTLAPSGQRGMAHALDIVAHQLTGGLSDGRTMPWHTVTEWQAQQVAVALKSKHSHAYAAKIMAAFRGVSRSAVALGVMSEASCRAVCAVKVERTAPPAKAGRVLTPEEIAAMFAVLDATPGRVACRDAAMLETMLTTGLKRGVIVALPFDAVLPETERLEKWRELRGDVPGPLFCSVHKGQKPLTDQCVRLMVRKAGRMAGIGTVTAQDLKRTWKARVKC